MSPQTDGRLIVVRLLNLLTSSVSWLILGVAVMCVGFLVGAPVGAAYSNLDMTEEVQDRVVDLDDLPAVDVDNPRVLPSSVAYDYGQNSLQYPQHRMTGEDITYINGTPHWSYALAPDGLSRSILVNQAGGVYVDMTTRGSSVTVHEDEFVYGQGMIAWRNSHWQMLKSDYTIQPQDPMMVTDGETQYIVVPYREYSINVRALPVPSLYSVPEFGSEKSGLLHTIGSTLGFSERGEEYGGVMIIHTDGTIEDVSPTDALAHPCAGRTAILSI